MSFQEQYGKLNTTDRETFRRMVNWLLAHTFLLQQSYAAEDGLRRTSQDYLFVERNFELFQDYLGYAGFALQRDGQYGVIYLESGYEENRVRLDKLTTLLLYTLRLVYEEEREKLSLASYILTTTGDLVHKMLSLGAVRKKPSNAQLRDAFRILERFRAVEKIEGSWEAADARIWVLPTVLFLVSNERISNMRQLLDEEDPAEAGEYDAR